MFGGLFQRAIRAGRIVACAALMVGCTQTIHNDPINQPLTANPAQVAAELGASVETNYDDMVVALSFSGGGMRAAAFSYGVLRVSTRPRADAQRVGVAARSARLSLRRFGRLDAGGLLRAARARSAGRFQAALPSASTPRKSLQTELSLGNIARGLQGGVNDTTGFPVWLDAHLFNHATFKDLLRPAAAAGLDQRLRHL